MLLPAHAVAPPAAVRQRYDVPPIAVQVLDFLNQSECCNFAIEWGHIVQALDHISKTSTRDSAGVTVLIIRAFVVACPDAAVHLFSNVLQHASVLASFCIEGTVYGKESKFPTVDKTRAILPLPAILTVVDAMIAVKMGECIDAQCQVPPGISGRASPDRIRPAKTAAEHIDVVW